MKRCDIPKRWRSLYWNRCSLIALGDVKDSCNPYFAVEEKMVQNSIVRFIGARPNPYRECWVEVADGTNRKICLKNFKTFEIVTELEGE